MNKITIRTLTLAALSIITLSVFNFFTAPFSYAQSVVVVDSSFSGISNLQTAVQSSGSGAVVYVMGLDITNDAVKVYTMNQDTGALSLSSTISYATIAQTNPVQTGTARAMMCTGNICFLDFDGSTVDRLIGVNIFTNQVVGAFDATTNLKLFSVRSSAQVYVQTDNSGANRIALISTPNGVCSGDISTCTNTWISLAAGLSGLTFINTHFGAYGVISGTPYIAYFINVANPNPQLFIYDVTNNGFSLKCSKNIGAVNGYIFFANGKFWVNDNTGTGTVKGWDTSESGGTCDAADVSIAPTCGGATTSAPISASTPNNELYIGCDNAVTIANMTSGTALATISTAESGATNYVTYNYFKDAIITGTGNTKIRAIFYSGLDFENFNPEGSRNGGSGDTDNPDANIVNGINCSLPENEFKLVCRLADNAGALSAASVSITQSGNNIVCQIKLLSCTQNNNGQFTPDNPDLKTNGVGFLLFVVLLGIMVGILWVASRGDLMSIPNYIWIMASLAILGASTFLQWIDATMLVLGVLCVIALAAAKLRSTAGGGGGMLLAE